MLTFQFYLFAIAVTTMHTTHATAVTQYEAEDADLSGAAMVSSCTRASGGAYVKNIGNQWSSAGILTFTIPNVYRDGIYPAQIEYMTAATRYLDITLNDDSTTSARYEFPISGKWCYENGDTATKTINMYLYSGENTIKFENSAGNSPLIDYIIVPTYPLPQGTIYEAEDATTGGDATVSTCDTASNGQIVDSIDNSGSSGSDNYVEFNVDAEHTGIHYMLVGYYSSEDVNIEITVNNGDSTTIKFPASGIYACDGDSESEGSVNYYSVNVDLNFKGSNTIRINGASGESASSLSIDFITLTKKHPKKGLVGASSEYNDVLKDYISWYYKYGTTEDEYLRLWSDANNIEFVPMLGWPIMTPYGETDKCALIPWAVTDKIPTMCTYQQVENDILSNNMSRVKYIMGGNEPWNSGNFGYMNFTGGAYVWANYIQPLKENLGLKLVSPNVKQASKGLDWLEGFLKKCIDDDTCDVDTIDVFAVHEYKCKEYYWEIHYDESDGDFFTNMKSRMGTYGSKDWDTYIDNMKLWVTETNCYWEQSDPHLTNNEMCQAITFQSEGVHGLGSIQWFDRSNRIDRYSWWATASTDETKTQMLVDYYTEEALPCGKGYMNPVSTTDCQ